MYFHDLYIPHARRRPTAPTPEFETALPSVCTLLGMAIGDDFTTLSITLTTSIPSSNDEWVKLWPAGQI